MSFSSGRFRGNDDALACLSGGACLFFCVFVGLLVGLGYQEVANSRYAAEWCVVERAFVRKRYCCDFACDQCGDASAAPTCAVLSGIAALRDPALCAANASQCAPPSLCDNGYACCAQSCSYVSRSTSIFSTSKVLRCDCVASTSHRACFMSCGTCYSARVEVRFLSDGALGVSDVDFGADLAGATLSAAANAGNATRRCFRGTDTFLLSVDFTPWKWLVIGLVGALPLQLFLLGLTRLRCGEKTRSPIAATVALWAGLLWPFGVLLPIYLWGATSEVAYTALPPAIFACTLFGNACLAYAILEERPRRRAKVPEPPPEGVFYSQPTPATTTELAGV